MAAEALPAPTTMVRPLGGAGRCRGTIFSGSAASTAAANMAFNKARGESTIAEAFQNIVDPGSAGFSRPHHICPDGERQKQRDRVTAILLSRAAPACTDRLRGRRRYRAGRMPRVVQDDQSGIDIA